MRSFGHYNHDEMLAVYYLVVLAFLFRVATTSLWIIGWVESGRANLHLIYGYPVLLMQDLMAWVYFSSALVKIRVAGVKYLSADNLPVLAIFIRWIICTTQVSRLAFWLPQVRVVLPFVVGLVLVWELVFPVAIVWRRARWWILGFGVLFHIATLFLMNIFFPISWRCI